MKDFPLLTTENGIASLKLSQIPYTRAAYITLRDSKSPEALLADCTSFCRAVGAEQIYACGSEILAEYPVHTQILQMCVDKDTIEMSDAVLTPVTQDRLVEFRTFYNEKMSAVPNASYMTQSQAKEAMGKAYFVHRDGVFLGIVMGAGSEIDAIAGNVPGAGESLVRGLCAVLTGEKVTLTVASANARAVNLYRRLGFSVTEVLATWYKIF